MGVSGEALVPAGLACGAALEGLAKVLEHRIRHEKRRLGRPAQFFLGLAHVVRPQRRTMCLEAVLLRRAIAQMRTYHKQRGSLRLGTRLRYCGFDRGKVVAIPDPYRVPAICSEPSCA